MSNHILDNNYAVTGTTLTEFFEELTRLDKQTGFKTIPANGVEVWSQLPFSLEKTILISTASGTEERTFFKPSTILCEKTKGMLDSFEKEKEGLISLPKESSFFARNSAVVELCHHCSLAGNAILTPSLERDRYLTALLANTSKKVTAVYRFEGALKKIMAFRSGSYCPVPQMTLRDIFEAVNSCDLGAVKTVKWAVTHDISWIELRFPDLADEFQKIYGLPKPMVPGLILATSSTGFCSVTAIETWTIGDSSFEKDAIRRKHRGIFSVSEFVEDCREEIFKNYTRLPEKLCDLFTEEIALPTDTHKEANIKNAVASACKQIKLTSVFKDEDGKGKGSGYVKSIIEQVTTELASLDNVSAYDVAIAIMTVPDRIVGLPDSYMKNLKKACGNAAFADYSIKAGKSKEVVLVA